LKKLIVPFCLVAETESLLLCIILSDKLTQVNHILTFTKNSINYHTTSIMRVLSIVFMYLLVFVSEGEVRWVAAVAGEEAFCSLLVPAIH
jgi:hypothetical protein